MKGELSSSLTGCRKNYSTQHCLVNMVKERKNKLDKDKIIGSILMHLSKAFDIINMIYQLEN